MGFDFSKASLHDDNEIMDVNSIINYYIVILNNNCTLYTPNLHISKENNKLILECTEEGVSERLHPLFFTFITNLYFWYIEYNNDIEMLNDSIKIYVSPLYKIMLDQVLDEFYNKMSCSKLIHKFIYWCTDVVVKEEK